MKRAVFEVKQNPLGNYYFAFKDPYGQTSVISCNFPDRAELESCLAKVRDTAAVADVCRDATNAVSTPFFLVGDDGCGVKFSLIGFYNEIIFSSIPYLDWAACSNAIHMLKANSQRAQVIDLTLD